MNPVGELLRVEDIHLDLEVPDKGRLLERPLCFPDAMVFRKRRFWRA